jgi:hypothetical protein
MKVGFELKVQILHKQMFIFISKLFHTIMQDYNCNT